MMNIGSITSEVYTSCYVISTHTYQRNVVNGWVGWLEASCHASLAQLQVEQVILGHGKSMAMRYWVYCKIWVVYDRMCIGCMAARVETRVEAQKLRLCEEQHLGNGSLRTKESYTNAKHIKYDDERIAENMYYTIELKSNPQKQCHHNDTPKHHPFHSRTFSPQDTPPHLTQIAACHDAHLDGRYTKTHHHAATVRSPYSYHRNKSTCRIVLDWG